MWNAANVARVGRSCSVCLAGLALVDLPASLAEAAYGPRTKIGKNYQQSSNTRSTNGSTEGSCNGFGFCYILFGLPSGQKALIVQHVSCLVSVAAGSLLYGSLRTRKGQTFPFRRTALMAVPTTTGTRWVVNSPVMHLVQSGERPFVFLQNSTNANWGSTICTISGKLQ
jgi:hypothetical protein